MDFKRREKVSEGERLVLQISPTTSQPNLNDDEKQTLKGRRESRWPIWLVVVFLGLIFFYTYISNGEEETTSENDEVIQAPQDKFHKNHQELEAIINKFAMGLLSSNKYHDRLRVAHEDWGHKWVERGLLWYYSDRPDNITNLIHTERCDDSYHGPLGLCCKTRYLFEHLQKVRPDADWFLRAMDDTYIFVENVARLVKKLDPEQPWLIGAKNCQRHAVGSFGKYFQPTPARAFFPDGGPGWLVSKGFLKVVNPHWNMWDEIVRTVMPVDDCAFGVFAAAHDIGIIHYKGFSQEPGDYPTCKECPYLCNNIGNKWTKPWIPVTFHQHWHGILGKPNELKTLDAVLHMNFDFDEVNPYQEFPQKCGCNQTIWYFDRCNPFTET